MSRAFALQARHYLQVSRLGNEEAIVHLRSFVRNAPQYQHMPDRKLYWNLWRVFAGFLYYLKQRFLFGRVTNKKIEILRSMKDSNLRLPALIIGNGPSQNSLTIEQIGRLKACGAKIFVMNSFNKTSISLEFSPDYYFLLDPNYENEGDPERTTALEYIEANANTTLIVSSLSDIDPGGNSRILHINGISAVGLWKRNSPILPNTHPQGVLFSALELASYLGHSPIYVTGVDNSFYLHHFHNQGGEIFVQSRGLHSYFDEESERWPVIPYLTRSMADVLYAHAVFLRDLKEFGKNKNVVNVGLADFTNDAFPFGCLLPQGPKPT